MHHGGKEPELDPLSRRFPVWEPSDLATIVGAIRSDLADRSQDGSAPTLDEFLGLVQAWLSAYPQHYLDADGCVEDLGGRLFADALLAAASGGEFTTRWRAWSVDFDDE